MIHFHRAQGITRTGRALHPHINDTNNLYYIHAEVAMATARESTNSIAKFVEAAPEETVGTEQAAFTAPPWNVQLIQQFTII